MSYGKVSIDEQNLFQGDLPTVEKRILYIGNAPLHQNTWQYINQNTDLDAVFGSATSNLKTQLLAAKANGGEQWNAYAISKAAGTSWAEAFGPAVAALGTPLDFEGLAVCEPLTTSGEIEDLALGLIWYLAPAGIFPFVLCAVPGIDAATQEWSDYKAAMQALVGSIAKDIIVAVPMLHGNNIGVLGGRLCRRDVSVADSPMRTATGSVVGLGTAPVDKNGIVIGAFDLNDLAEIRLSVPQMYINYEGTYWSDASTLAASGSDFAVLENLRVVRKAQRAVRRLQISRVADRKLNNTPASIASNKNYFMRPLREMSKGFTFGGITFPGDIKPPADDAIEIVWTTRTQVDIWLKVTPYESPKDLRAHIVLDLSTGSVTII